MGTVRATLEIDVPVAVVYEYLRNRYQSPIYQAVSTATLGYVPEVWRKDDVPDRRLSFWVAGRDVMLKIRTGGWQWGYDLEAVSESRTRVTITYQWSALMTPFTLFTIRHQACSEIGETAMALEALVARSAEPAAGAVSSRT